MDNNKRIIELEVRVMKLESIIEGFSFSIGNANHFNPTCQMCGISPLSVDSCQQINCPHGLHNGGGG